LFIVNLIVNFFSIESVIDVFLLIALILFDTLHTNEIKVSIHSCCLLGCPW
jgi:hypothetical protein